MALLMLDYQRSPRRVGRAGVLAMLLALAGLASIAVDYYAVREATAAWEAKTDALERKSSKSTPASGAHGAAESRSLALEIKHANQVLRELSVPWEAMFQAVEDAGGKDVTLLSMEPDAHKHVAKIAGEARNLTAVLNYMRQLERQQVFRDVHLQHHQIEQQDPERPVRFIVLAAWEMKP